MRITTEETSRSIRFRLEGKLSGPWVTEFERVLETTLINRENRTIFIDVNGLSGADADGRILLALLQQAGAVMQVDDPLSASLLSVGWSEAESAHAVKN